MADITRLDHTDFDTQIRRCEENAQAHQERVDSLRQATAGGQAPTLCKADECSGVVDYQGFVMPCPLDGQGCPFSPGRTERLRHRLLQGIGFRRRYWDSTPEGIPLDPVRGEIDDYLLNLDRNLREGRGLLIAGGVGSGKTCLLAVIGFEAARAGHGVEYFYAPALFDLLHRDERDRIEEARDCSLLLLDDFGVQYGGDWVLSRFDALMEHRYGSNLAVCVTTNANLRDMSQSPQYRRVIDRWRDTCVPVATGIESLRGLKEDGP